MLRRPVLPKEPPFAQTDGRNEAVPVLRAKQRGRRVAATIQPLKWPLAQPDVLPARAVQAQGARQRRLAYTLSAAAQVPREAAPRARPPLARQAPQPTNAAQIAIPYLVTPLAGQTT